MAADAEKKIFDCCLLNKKTGIVQRTIPVSRPTFFGAEFFESTWNGSL
jgi:hypothetical protein